MSNSKSDCTIFCRNCGREIAVSVEWLRTHFDANKTTAKITKADMADDIKRLKCTRCGAKEAALIWHNKPATIQKPRSVRRMSSTAPYKKPISKPHKKTYAKPNIKRTNAGTKTKIAWRKTEQTDDAVAVRQRNSAMLRKQSDYKQRTAVKYRNRPDIFVIHSDDD